MFEGFTTTDIDVPAAPFGGARIHLRHGGDGPPLLLLHGNPMTHVAWHKIANRLAEHFHVVAADLRGYGDSVGPDDAGPNSINYSFRAMAQDQVEVMEKLGYREFFAAGHDRGARTVARMCLDRADRVKRAALVDILPNHHIWTNTSRQWALRSWHWAMMAQPYDFPERMLAGISAQYFMEKKLSKPGIGLGFFDQRLLRRLPRLRDLRFRDGHRRFRGRPQDHRAASRDLGRAQPYRRRAWRRACGVAAALRDRRLGWRAAVRPLRARGSAG
jgi:haloacetate dehalogenase